MRLVACLTLLLSSPALAEIELSGDPVQGGLMRGSAPVGATVELNGEPVRTTKDGAFVIGFGRDVSETQWLTVTSSDGAVETKAIKVGAREWDIERVDGLPERTVTIPEAEQKRRAKERGMVGSARADLSERLHWLGEFRIPAEGRISGHYGSQRILNGKPRFPHYGLDIANKTGTPIIAPLAGRVVLAEPDFLLEGGIVILDHGFGVTSTLFHMSRVDVAVGDEVEAGTQIGAIGAKGRASGPHVDWRVNWHSVRLDPALLIDGK